MRRIQITGIVILFVLLLLVPQSRAEVTLVQFGKETEWRYQDNGKAVSPDWLKPDFVDSKWAVGAAPLGYGDSGISTTVSYGGDQRKKHITTYFRHRFQIADAAKLSKLVLLIRSDDGIVVYLNGKEVLRNNLPQGQITPSTTAILALGGLYERLYQRFEVQADHLVAGNNVIAVEVHQANPQSTDLFLDLVLRGYRDNENLRPTLASQARQATVDYHSKHYLGPQLKINDGYVDGGRGMKLDEDGQAQSRREVIIVDRKRDAALRKHLEFARSDEIMSLKPLKRAIRLANYIDKEMSLNKDSRLNLAAVSLMRKEYANQGVLIGDVSRICGAGVCRHRALLFKILADEAELNTALVRGNYGEGDRFSGHAWNELHLKDGRKILIDVMQRRVELIATEGSESSRRYRTVQNKPWYGKTEKSRQ